MSRPHRRWKRAERGERGWRDSGSHRRGSAMCCYQLIPAPPLPSPFPGHELLLSPLLPSPHTPAPKTQRGRAAAVPSATPSGWKPSCHPKVTTGCSSSFLCELQGLSWALFLWVLEPHSFPGWFSRIPLTASRQAESWGLSGYSLWHPQLTSTESIFILWPPLATLYPRKDLPFVFYGSKTGQQLCRSSQNPAGTIWVGTMNKPPVATEAPSLAKSLSQLSDASARSSTGSEPSPRLGGAANTHHLLDQPRWISTRRAWQAAGFSSV